MRSQGVLHYWFPTYDKEFATYSPGLMLLLAMVEDAQTREIHLIDLGRGHAPYKDRFANGAFGVAEGTAATTSGWESAVSLRKRGAGVLLRAWLAVRQRVGQRGGASAP
jgi:CelD/BcsL family acetyltransferase involved in cellulose biosynthesis